MNIQVLPPLWLLLIVLTLTSGCGTDSGVDPSEASPEVIATEISVDSATQDTVVEVFFNTDMAGGTIDEESFLVMEGSELIDGIVTYEDSTAIFRPTVLLSGDDIEYTGTITTDVEDAEGRPLQAEYEWTFSLSWREVTATAGPHGTITPSGSVGVDPGEDISFSIAPDPGYYVADIRVDGESVHTLLDASSSYTLQVEADHTVEAIFTDVPKYIMVNIHPDTRHTDFETIANLFESNPASRVQVGIGFRLSYLHRSPDKIMEYLTSCLALAEQYDVPVVIQPDGEQWWAGRQDLWNWWAPDQPGYDPDNQENVEWSGWSPDSAVKIGWRNWGAQLRVDPMPNLMSPDYREAAHTEMEKILTATLDWWQQLPEDQKDLFVGMKIGWESAIGVNNWYYPNGNDYIDEPEANDPTYGIDVNDIPARGVAPIGYAAVQTAGLANSGELREADLAEVIRIHLEDLSKQASVHGIPRDRLFTHPGGWSEGELLYEAGLNEYASPGWSFYEHAENPENDVTAMEALASSEASQWGAVEWLYLGEDTQSGWTSALYNTLSHTGMRHVNIYNWRQIKDNQNAVSAIQAFIE